MLIEGKVGISTYMSASMVNGEYAMVICLRTLPCFNSILLPQSPFKSSGVTAWLKTMTLGEGVAWPISRFPV